MAVYQLAGVSAPRPAARAAASGAVAGVAKRRLIIASPLRADSSPPAGGPPEDAGKVRAAVPDFAEFS